MASLSPQAWAVFKGKLRDGSQDNPASWKTRLRCALNKSTEFMEVMERAQLDISEPYKVYRLVPVSEQSETSASYTHYFYTHCADLERPDFATQGWRLRFTKKERSGEKCFKVTASNASLACCQ